VRLPEGRVKLLEGRVKLPEGRVKLVEGRVKLLEGHVKLLEGHVKLLRIQARREGTVFKHTSIVQDSSSPHTIFEHRQTTIEHHRTGRIQTHSQRALHYSSQPTSSAQAHIQAQSHRTVFKHAHLQPGSRAAAALG
jgi:hypothetical protein